MEKYVPSGISRVHFIFSFCLKEVLMVLLCWMKILKMIMATNLWKMLQCNMVSLVCDFKQEKTGSIYKRNVKDDLVNRQCIICGNRSHKIKGKRSILTAIWGLYRNNIVTLLNLHMILSGSPTRELIKVGNLISKMWFLVKSHSCHNKTLSCSESKNFQILSRWHNDFKMV